MTLHVEYLPASSLIPYARNMNKHSDQHIAEIAASIKEFGWTIPILVDAENSIVAGHGRVLAAQKLGIDTVPVLRRDNWTKEQIKAYRIADNRLPKNAHIDTAMLGLELQELKGAEFELGLLGFDDDELAALLNPEQAPAEGLTDPDAMPENAETRCKPGDLWILGNHRLLCGDSTNVQHVERLMGGEKADLCFTSPPYGQQRDYGAGKVSDWDNLMNGVFSILPMADGAQVLVNLGMIHRDNEWMPYWDKWLEYMRSAGWRRFGLYVWDQGPGLPGDWNGRLAPAFEFVFHFNKEAKRANKTKPCKHAGSQNHGTGLRGKDGTVGGYTAIDDVVQDTKIPDSVIRVMRHKARGIETQHPAVFPVELVEEVSAAFSKSGHALYEPFCGSGTTLIACEKTNRRCFGMELDARYCDVVLTRWEKFTGQQARRLEDESGL